MGGGSVDWNPNDSALGSFFKGLSPTHTYSGTGTTTSSRWARAPNNWIDDPGHQTHGPALPSWNQTDQGDYSGLNSAEALQRSLQQGMNQNINYSYNNVSNPNSTIKPSK